MEFDISLDDLLGRIYSIRGLKVMMDRDLAALYGVTTKNLKRSVKRNMDRFPEDFMFQMSVSELENWRCQFGTSNFAVKMGVRYRPYVFTELGVAMLSSVLGAKRAVLVNIEIMRAFVQLRKILASQVEMSKRLDEIRDFVLKQSQQNTREFKKVWNAIEALSSGDDGPAIGFLT